MAAFEIVEVMGRVVEGAAGLRFVFSPSYRKRTRERWKAEAWPQVFVEVVGAAIGVALLALVAYLIGRYLLGIGAT
jgi:hypothetical protein